MVCGVGAVVAYLLDNARGPRGVEPHLSPRETGSTIGVGLISGRAVRRLLVTRAARRYSYAFTIGRGHGTTCIRIGAFASRVIALIDYCPDYKKISANERLVELQIRRKKTPLSDLRGLHN